MLRVMRRQYFPSMADSRKSQLEHLAMYLAFPLFRWQIRAAQSESLARRQAVCSSFWHETQASPRL